jgi:hypothetical protein
MAASGQQGPFAGTVSKVRFRIRKRTIEPTAASHNDLFVGYVGFAISKRKQLVGADLVAC